MPRRSRLCLPLRVLSTFQRRPPWPSNPPSSPLDSLGGLRPPRCGSRRRARRRRAVGALRRDGQPLRAEPDDRSAGVRGTAQARRDRADRRAPDGQAGRPHRAGLRQGGRDEHQLPSGGQRTRRPHDPADQELRLHRRSGVQPGHAAVLSGLRDGQDRPGAADEREPRLRRTELHSVRAGQAARGARAHRPAAAARSGWRSTAASSRTTSARSRAPGPTPSSPARRSSTRRTTARWWRR